MEIYKPKVEAKISSHRRSIYSVCYSPDQTKLCTVGIDKKVILTNLQNKKIQKIFTGHERGVVGSDFSSNGYFLATASLDKTVRIWNVESENGNSIKLIGHSHYVRCIRYFHNDSKKVISCSRDETIKIWDIERKKEISTLKGCKGLVNSVDILPDNQTIVSGDGNIRRGLRIWDFRSGKCVKLLDNHKHHVSSVQFHPNTFSLASGSYDKTIKTFDFRTFQLLQNYEEHSESVRSVCFHPSGKFLISGSSSIKIFDLSEKKVLYNLNDHSKTVWSVQFSPDGKNFASGSRDSNVIFWNFPLGRMLICDEKDIDEEERVKYLVERDLLIFDGGRSDCCERINVLKIRIDDFHNLYCYKFLFVLET